MRLAEEAVGLDRSITSLRNPNLPLLTVGEAEYLLGLAYSTREHSYPRPEHALVYFRQFLKVAPDSPWRKRAEDKIRELKDARLPEEVQRSGGNAEFNRDTATAVVRKGMPAMRQCMAKISSSVLSVTVTRVGPRSAPATTATPRPTRPGRNDLQNPFASRSPYVSRPMHVPPAGITINVDPQSVPGAPTADVDSAIRCIEPLAAKLPLPAIRDKDAYYRVTFFVVAP